MADSEFALATGSCDPAEVSGIETVAEVACAPAGVSNEPVLVVAESWPAELVAAVRAESNPGDCGLFSCAGAEVCAAATLSNEPPGCDDARLAVVSGFDCAVVELPAVVCVGGNVKGGPDAGGGGTGSGVESAVAGTCCLR